MLKFRTAHLRFTTFLRRQAWELRQLQCNWTSLSLLLLFGLSFLSFGLWLFPLTRLPINVWTKDSNVLRWGVNDAVVLLVGQDLQRSLPLDYVYPNGAENKFTCDLPALRYQCDMDNIEGCKSYPQLFPSAALFENWNPENTDQIPQTIFDSICHFNVSNPYELRLAQMFREMEVPFVAYGVPELLKASEQWTDEYLTEKLTPTTPYKVHIANNSHYMYFSKKQRIKGEKRPYTSKWMTYPQFVKILKDVKLLHEAGKPHEYYYFMLKTTDFFEHASFIYEELRFLNPLATEHDSRYGDLFVRDYAIAKEIGMRCRLGMQGIIAEGHVDSGLNFVSMIRGTKRYVLAPPSVCKCLGLIKQGAIVALTAGEVLYIPPFWYHHIVSTDTSIQCNLRSGFIDRSNTQDILSKCGLPVMRKQTV
ncbi:unnamed protein product [Peronospora belbahrii]|uniref:Cupin-like domain-containing protein n=1 Tax=Peronospora belbahrii TaxID=622444 RepID=A0AAU9KKT8_9STRA|nr:unnamed protein product [Peronospora belbahrii]